MPQLPSFPLTAFVWRDTDWTSSFPPIGEFPCELIMRKLVVAHVGTVLATARIAVVELWFPAGTDVRGWEGSSSDDVVEFPADSGRLYRVVYVDDYAKGHPNEFRVAYAQHFLKPEPLP